MKVYIGPYKNWFGPYQLAEKLMFWVDRHDRRVFKFGQWLAGDKDEEEGMSTKDRQSSSMLYKFLVWVDSKKKRKVKIRIDNYDTWSADATLALIILPMLKQLKEYKHGSATVDLEDVPEALRSTNTESYEAQSTFDFYSEAVTEGAPDVHTRWSWVLDEMIWAFEQIQPDVDWEEQYRSGELDMRWKKTEESYIDPETGETNFVSEMVRGPDDTYQVDYEGMKKHQARIDNGFRLFGKYYQGLWD